MYSYLMSSSNSKFTANTIFVNSISFPLPFVRLPFESKEPVNNDLTLDG